jgi:phosphatidylserine synthase
LDHKEVKRAKSARSGPHYSAAGPAASKGSRRLLALYGFAGATFSLGFAALMLVIRNDLPLAGRIVLAATVPAGWEYYVRQRSTGPVGHVDELTTLSDLLCFSVAPGFLLYRLTLQHWGILGLGTVFVIVFAGVLRLSLFKIFNPVDEKRDFIGLPLTVSAAFITLLAQMSVPGEYTPFLRLGLLALLVILAFLTVSTLHYPNPSTNPWFTAGLAAVVAAVWWGPPVARPAAWLLLAGGTAFVIFAPWLGRQAGPQAKRKMEIKE